MLNYFVAATNNWCLTVTLLGSLYVQKRQNNQSIQSDIWAKKSQSNVLGDQNNYLATQGKRLIHHHYYINEKRQGQQYTYDDRLEQGENFFKCILQLQYINHKTPPIYTITIS